jgi:syntaxin 7
MSFAESSAGNPLQDNCQRELSNAIYEIAANNSKIERGIKSPQQRHQVSELVLKTRNLAKSTSHLLKDFMALADPKLKISQTKLSKDFDQVLNNFQKLSKKVAQVSREAVKVSHQEEELVVEESTPLLRKQFDHQLDSQIVINERVIQEREEDLQGLERSILEVNEIFRDLGTIVHEQQFLLGTNN